MKHIGNWVKSENKEEYISSFGVICKKNNKEWIGFVRDGFGYRSCEQGFAKVRDAMIVVEDSYKKIKKNGSPLPPIMFPAHIFN